MKELIIEHVRQLVLYGGLFFLLFVIDYFIQRRTDWEKIREAEMEEIIIRSLRNGSAITAHSLFLDEL